MAIDNVIKWLQQELNDDLSIIPHINLIPDNLHKVKGIYFWFMKSTGYSALSSYVLITPTNNVYKRIINGEEFHLVYLGTAGMGKKGGNDLFGRLKWHIENRHTESSVLNGTLSTLRQGLGALLSNDLILPDTEELINDFIKSYMRVFWISYEGKEHLINEVESSLIQNIRPLLNSKENPNAHSNALPNSTLSYNLRRKSIIKSTLDHLTDTKKAQDKEVQIISNNNNYTEFFVNKNESIADVVKGIYGLPEGKVKFSIVDASDPTHPIFPTWNKTGAGRQNIYTYFDNTGGSDIRYKLIQKHMQDNEIEKILVKVYDDNGEYQENIQKKSFVKIDSFKYKNMGKRENTQKQEEIELSKNFKVVMICASMKNGEYLKYMNNDIHFKAVSIPNENTYRPDDLIPNENITWRNYICENQSKIPLQAYELYTRDIYRSLFKRFGNNLYILSAGWGLVRANYGLPKYDITFSRGKNQENNRRVYNTPVYSDFNQLSVDNKEDIVFVGTPDYLQLFFKCTEDLSNRKIIYYKKDNLPNTHRPPNNSFLFIRYITNTRMKWYYELAMDLVKN